MKVLSVAWDVAACNDAAADDDGGAKGVDTSDIVASCGNSDDDDAGACDGADDGLLVLMTVYWC